MMDAQKRIAELKSLTTQDAGEKNKINEEIKELQREIEMSGKGLTKRNPHWEGKDDKF